MQRTTRSCGRSSRARTGLGASWTRSRWCSRRSRASRPSRRPRSAPEPTFRGSYAPRMDSARKHTILFIHGLWMTPRSWEKWMERYESRGHRVLAPSWPGLEVEVEALNEDPTPLKQLDIDKVVGH